MLDKRRLTQLKRELEDVAELRCSLAEREARVLRETWLKHSRTLRKDPRARQSLPPGRRRERLAAHEISSRLRR
jgi:hypothetical protein